MLAEGELRRGWPCPFCKAALHGMTREQMYRHMWSDANDASARLDRIAATLADSERTLQRTKELIERGEG